MMARSLEPRPVSSFRLRCANQYGSAARFTKERTSMSSPTKADRRFRIAARRYCRGIGVFQARLRPRIIASRFMPNCRSIPPEAWARAREALVFYFSRRHGRSNAEDLEQETLATLWSRDDYEFEKEDDFPRVCLGFARRISQEGFREAQRHSPGEPDHEISSPRHHASGQAAVESRILLEEVCRIGESQLRDREWQLILRAASSAGAPAVAESHRSDANKFRVYLFRARRKLRQATGWRKSNKV
jgi:hypothetical protein